MTDMPWPCQSSISSRNCSSTASGNAAGPALKLNTRFMDAGISVRMRTGQSLSGASRGRAVRTACAYADAGGSSGRCWRTRLGGAIAEHGTGPVHAVRHAVDVSIVNDHGLGIDGLHADQAFALVEANQPHALRVAPEHRHFG